MKRHLSIEEVRAQCRAAAFGDLNWNDLLETICLWVGGDKALFFSEDTNGIYKVPYSYNFDLAEVSKYNLGVNIRDPRAKHSKEALAGMTRSGQEYIRNTNLKNTDYFNEIYRPNDSCDSLHSVIMENPDTGRQALSIHRGLSKDFFEPSDIDRMQAILPHLIDAYSYSIYISGNIGPKTSNERCGVLIDKNFLVTPLTGNLEKVLSGCNSLSFHGDYLRPANETVKAFLSLAFSNAEKGKTSSAKFKLVDSHSIDETKSVKVTLQKLCNAIQWMDPERNMVMLHAVVESEENLEYHTELFAATFNLTLAETRIVECLIRKDDLRDAAKKTGIRYETVRWHVKNVLQKTLYNRRDVLLRAVRNLDLSNAG